MFTIRIFIENVCMIIKKSVLIYTLISKRTQFDKINANPQTLYVLAKDKKNVVMYLIKMY